MAAAQKFKGEIRVASRIIDYLSSGLYHTPAACLKELVNNSFDADARDVHIFVRPEADRIIIQDNGLGISKEEFTQHFDHIAESHKREGGEKTPSGRPKIGKIGIGFIAANELCERMELFSTKRGSTELLHISIDFGELRKSAEERKREGLEYSKADYVGEILAAQAAEHYTHIFLQDVRGGARSILAGLETARRESRLPTVYGLKLESIEKLLKSPHLNTWKDLDSYSENYLQIGLNVPVCYFPNWIPASGRDVVRKFERETEKLEFSVWYDGTEMRKPIVFESDADTLVRPFEFRGKNVAARGYVYAQHGTVKPRELHGLLVRIRNAAVGEYDPAFWGFSQSEYSLIQKWVSVEIWADDRLEDAMNIDRRTLRTTHPAYMELRDAIHQELRETFSETRSRIYEKGSRERKTARAVKARKSIAQAVATAGVPTGARKTIEDSWSGKGSGRPLLRKYTVGELYEVIVETANEVLSPQQKTSFLRRLTERLTRG